MRPELKTPLVDDGEAFLSRVAWAYYIEGLTQAQVAEKLGTTRLRVNKALSEARRQGLVRISLNTAYAPCAELEATLERRFNLTRAYVAPSPSNAEDSQMVVGAALGHLLTDLLSDPEIRMFGMSWGNTLNFATRFMAPLHRPDLEIVSVMGGIMKGSDLNSFEITTRLGDLVNAQISYFPAPLYADSAESRATMMSLAVFRDVVERIRSVDALAMAAGDLSERSLLMRDALPSDVRLEELIALGGVGDVLGTVIDRNGHPVDHPMNERVIGLALDELTRVPNVILAAGGAHKVPVISALLRRGCVNSFVSDEATARSVLERCGETA